MESGPVEALSDDALGKGAADPLPQAAQRLSQRWLPAARVVWVLLAALLVALFLAGNALYYRQAAAFPQMGNFVQVSNPAAYRTALSQLGLSTTAYARLMVGLQLALMLVSAIAALLIFRHRKDSWWALFLSLTLVSLGASYPTTTDALERGYPGWSVLFNLEGRLSLVAFLELFYLFPDGQFVPRWTRWTALGMAALLMSVTLFPGSIVDLGPLGDLFGLANIGLFVTMIYAQVYRFRRVSGRVERQQTKWVIAGMVTVLLTLVVLQLAPQFFPGLVQPDTVGALYDMAATAVLLVVVLVIPLSIGMSILRYRLWDIDLIINRTLVYVPLTSILAGLYSVTLNLAQKLFVAFTGATSDTAIVLSTLLLVTTFSPIKDAIQGLVNRRFKQLPDSRAGVNSLNEQMHWFVQSLDETQLASRALDEVVLAFQAVGGAVYLESGGRLALAHRAGTWDAAAPASISLPLENGGHQYGSFHLNERRDGRAYSREDCTALRQTADLLAQTIATARRLNAAGSPELGE